MKKTLATRIIGLVALYCVVFFILVIFQFSNKGNFSLSPGAMTIRGRYLPDHQPDIQPDGIVSGQVTGGVRIFYGGIEFNLKEERENGLTLTGLHGAFPVNPEFMLLTETSARFILPGGTILIFNSLDSPRGAELQITAEFADNISEISVPIASRRSSVVRDNNQVGIVFSGTRYFFTSTDIRLETGKMVLSRDNSFASYRARSKQREFIPSDYIIAQVQNYESTIRSWQDSSFSYWIQNVSALQNEDDITAFLSETLQRGGNYPAAVNAITGNITSRTRLGFKSSAFIGRKEHAYPLFIASENDKLALITRSIRERSLAFLKEEHVVDYLFTRGRTTLANEAIEVLRSCDPFMLTIDYCAGLLEVFEDLERWYNEDLVERLSDQMLLLISGNLSRDTEKDTVFISSSDAQYSLRLGKALVYWAQKNQNDDWEGIGKSLVLSALAGSNSGNLYNTLKPAEYYPRATWLTEDHWVWTASPSARATFVDGNLNLAFSFPTTMAHFVIIRGIRPFIRIQIHGMEWRSDPQFEIYDSSGWVYYPDEQTLVLKLRHRSTVENVRIIYRVPPRPVVVPTPTPETEGDAGE